MDEWVTNVKELEDTETLKIKLERRKSENKEWHEKRLKLLDGFFAEHQSPVDIAIILNGGLASSYLLAEHIDDNALLYFTPKASCIKKWNEALSKGEINPDRTLLLFDADMIDGNAMRETANHFVNDGYSREKIFGYLNFGCKSRKYGTPELMHIDDILKI